MLSVKDVVERLDLGKSVAESDDEALFQNFIETGAYKRMRGGESDIVIGNKGTGKTSIYRKLASDAEALRGESIFLVESFDAVGQSNFQAITDIEPLEEAEYKNIWKLYIYALGAQVVVNEGPALDVDKNDLKSIVLTLKALGLERNVLGPKRKNPLTKLVQSITGRFKGIGFRGRISANIPIMGTVEAEIEGLESLDEEDGSYFINIDDALGTLSDTLENLGYCGWFVMDRLDEAFQGQGEIEKLALRALLRTYLDLNGLFRFQSALIAPRSPPEWISDRKM